MEGEAVEFGSRALDAPGFDLLPVLIGSESRFAVVTEVTLKLTPKPPTAQIIVASFNDLEASGDAFAAMLRAGIIPAGLEIMNRLATRAAEASTQAGYDLNAAAILLCESDGTPEAVAEEIARIGTVLKRYGATRLQIPRSEAERQRFWSGRQNTFPAASRTSPDFFCIDAAIPRRNLGKLLKLIGEMQIRYALRCINVFCAGDGNLHPLILFNGSHRKERLRAEAFGTEIVKACVKFGGTITGKHGVELDKINLTYLALSPEEHAACFAIKQAFDPAGLLNSDQAIPIRGRGADCGCRPKCSGLLPHAEPQRL
jgi:glycolate oxidase